MTRINYREYLSTLLDFIFPPTCLACKKSGSYLCANCVKLLPVSNKIQENYTAIFSYQHPIVKRAIHLLKYRGGKIIARDLAKLLQQHLNKNNFLSKNLEQNSEKFLVIPIPSSQKREKKRGYNQARELARELVKLNPDKLELAENILVKIKDTVSQVKTKNREERLENLRDAFAVTKNQKAQEISEKIKNSKIILLDDVITTGATMQEARKVLLASGAKIVLSLAIARG